MATQTASGNHSGSMFFSDGRSCKKWLGEIPLTNIAHAQQKLLDALRMLNADTKFVPIERLTAIELMREKVAFLLGQQRARYVGKTLPLPHADMAAWHTSCALLAEMELGYRRCYQDAQAEGSALAAHAALIIQRTIRYIGLGMLMAGFIYRRFDQGMWLRLHQQWTHAESRSLTDTRVKDSVGTADGYSSVAQAYLAVLLGQLADCHELGPREINFVDAMLKRFAHKVSIVRAEDAVSAADAWLAVDVLADAGASFDSAQSTLGNWLVLDVAALSQSIRRRVKKLAAGELPTSMDLPDNWSAPDAMAQLTRLHQRWCEPSTSRTVANASTHQQVIVTFGMAEIHFFLSGDLFEQPGVKREMSRQEMSDIAMFGRISESTIRARYAEFNYGSETWQVVDESRGLWRVARPANSSRGMAIGRLVGVRLNGGSDDFYLAVVRGLMEDTPGQFTVTLAMLPGKPEAISVRASDDKSRRATYTQGFRLPPMGALSIPETLIIPSNLAARGRGVDIFHPGHGSPKQVNVLEFVERGSDFDRVTISG